MSGFDRLVSAIRGRSVWEIVGSYVVVSWVALQVLDTLSTVVGLPLWFARAVFVLLVVGFFALALTGVVQSRWAARRAAAEGESGAGRLRHVITWRRAIGAGVAAFAVLGLFTAAWLAMRALGIGPAGSLIAKGILDERDVILLADFTSPDSSLARAATEALRVDISQSPSVRLADPSAISAALTRMERDPKTRLDPALALELAEREGIPAVLAGDVLPAGTGWVLSARLEAAGTGEILVSRRETAGDPSDVIPAIDRLSKGIRERIGEPLRSVQASPGLERVTTASLEALRKYSQSVAASREGDFGRSIDLAQEAVDIDSSFASAWDALAIQLGNFGEQRSREVDALRRAFEHRDRLTDRERFLVEGIYYLRGPFEPEKAVQAYRSLLDLDPSNATALNNLSVAYSQLRDSDRTIEYVLRAREADSTASLYWTNLADGRVSQGRLDEAAAALEDAEARFGGQPSIRWYEAQLAATRGDLQKARVTLRSIEEEDPGSLWIRASIEPDLASLTATQGQMQAAEAHLRTAAEANEARGLPAEALGDALQIAEMQLLLRSDTSGAVATIDSALERHPLSTLDPLDRPYAQLAVIIARTGNPGRARRLVSELESAVPAEIRGGTELDRLRAVGEIALAEGRYDDALEAFRASDRGDCVLCAVPGLATTYDRAGVKDSAMASYSRFIDTPYIDRYWGGRYCCSFLLGPYAERLATLLDEAGDSAQAAVYWAKVAELWEDADPEFTSRAEAAKKRLAEIVAQRG